jgi:multidrug efflux pump subunit AcrA (membrane-fusion protein)
MPLPVKSRLAAIKRVAIVVVVGAAAFAMGQAVRPGNPLHDWLAPPRAGGGGARSTAAADDHDHHDDHHHEHPGHRDETAIELSPQAQRNIGMQLMKIAPGTFERTITVPAVIVERPGRSEVAVTAALSGIVQKIYPLEGQAVVPGESLFELRLTHEELVQGQTDFLRTAEELDIVNREIARLEPLAEKGAIAIKTIIDHRYEREKLLGIQRAQRQGLLLHGLSTDQIDQILKSRTLLQSLTIRVPQGRDDPAVPGAKGSIYQVQKLQVERGQYVEAGQQLCVLTDHAELYIEGKAFEQDAAALNQLADKRWSVSALFERQGQKPAQIAGLTLLYVADKVETDSRTLRFFVRLPNLMVRDSKTPEGHRFVAWKFKPGQRLQLQVPVAVWTDRIVLPEDAVVQDGAEYFVFQQNGDHFDRRPVHVEYRDATSVVVANDGSLYPGDTVVTSGAQQMHLALKNKSAGGIDPHAGHQH